MKVLNKKIAAIKYIAGKSQVTKEMLTREEALQININDKPYTITMRSPGQDVFLAIGLLFTENIIRFREEIICISEIPAPLENYTLTIDIQVNEETLTAKNIFNRSIASSASCGVCGKAEICDIAISSLSLATAHKLDIELIPQLLQRMNAQQDTFEQTGGSHAAAVFNILGELLSVQEDIGRHNAVDKAIGDLFLRNQLNEASILFISGRVSYEIVAKCVQAGIPFLLGVSAPSSLAVDTCQQKGITLIGFCRENRATVYTHESNILQHIPADPSVFVPSEIL